MQSDFERPLHSFKIDDSRDAPLSKGCALNEGMCPERLDRGICPAKKSDWCLEESDFEHPLYRLLYMLYSSRML